MAGQLAGGNELGEPSSGAQPVLSRLSCAAKAAPMAAIKSRLCRRRRRRAETAPAPKAPIELARDKLAALLCSLAGWLAAGELACQTGSHQRGLVFILAPPLGGSLVGCVCAAEELTARARAVGKLARQAFAARTTLHQARAPASLGCSLLA